MVHQLWEASKKAGMDDTDSSKAARLDVLRQTNELLAVSSAFNYFIRTFLTLQAAGATTTVTEAQLKKYFGNKKASARR